MDKVDLFVLAPTMEQSNRQRCLAAHYYTDTSILREEKEKLFLKTWQFACHEKEIPAVGDFLTIDLFDQSIILLRTQNQSIRAYYNVCPHRGHQLVQGSGNKKRLVCPYHAWTYNLDGQLQAARGFQTEETICLSGVRTELLAGFVFVNLDDEAPSLAEFAPNLETQILAHCPEVLDYKPVVADTAGFGNTYHCRANWKVMLDNYLECYHCEGAHPTFNNMMNIKASTFQLFPNYTFQVAPTAMKEENQAFPLSLEHDVTVGHFWFLFPNTTLGQFPGVPGFYISRFDPIDPDNTNRVTTTLMIDPLPDADAQRRDDLRAEWNVNIVAREDKALCESVQKGLHQRGFQAGWYVTKPDAHNISEHAMRYFHDLYLKALNE